MMLLKHALISNTVFTDYTFADSFCTTTIPLTTDLAINELGVFGSATTWKMLKCTHYKRSLRAHIYFYLVLYALAMEQFSIKILTC